MVINGTSNREDGVIVTVTVIAGPAYEKIPSETDEIQDGKWSVTLDTSDAEPGIYTVQVEDEDGNIDEATFELLPSAFIITVSADKDVYTLGEVVRLNTQLQSIGGPYFIDFGIDLSYKGERWTFAVVENVWYPADRTWSGMLPLRIPRSRLVPPGDYHIYIWVKDASIGQLLGEGSDVVTITHGRLKEKIDITF
ncbi:MAG: hypothetical protein DRN91_02000 [Candidatus Alkanophagales archaeon]|nr:MAG: hypothetical protein DRN91_02000 [Candidatus Alkanophagales archaeon]